MGAWSVYRADPLLGISHALKHSNEVVTQYLSHLYADCRQSNQPVRQFLSFYTSPDTALAQ